jgi:hypothetical protein
MVKYHVHKIVVFASAALPAVVAEPTTFALSAILSTLPKPTIAFDIPPIVPVNVGLANLLLNSMHFVEQNLLVY